MKKMIYVLALASIASLGFSQSDDNPGSLWTNQSRNLFADRIARHVGDVVTILIQESSTSSFSAQTSTSKTDSNSILKGLGPILGSLIPELATGAKGTSAGQGSTTQAGKFSARMTVQITKILPNGNFVIEGVRAVRVNKDTQMLKLTGTVRMDDIRADNTILSENIADAQIMADGKGAISDRQRRGIINRILDWLF